MRQLWVALILSLAVLAGTPVLAAEITGSNGPDVLIGTAANDRIEGGTGSDEIHGAGGNDALAGGLGADRLHGNDGFDILDGDAGPDELYGGSGGDVLQLNLGPDVADGGPDSDLTLRGPGNATIRGGAGNDVLLGGALENVIDGGEGDDTIHVAGTAGPAKVDGGSGDDVCFVEARDQVTGCESVTWLSGSGDAPAVEITGGPAQDETVDTSSASFSFTTPGAAQVWCVSDVGPRMRCDSGTFTVTGLGEGTHALTVLAVGAKATEAAAIMRRFVVVPPPPPVFTALSTPAADTLVVSGQHLAALEQLRVFTADGDMLEYTLPDARVTHSAEPDEALTIVDPSLGTETVLRVDGVDDSEIVAQATGSVLVESSMALSNASSPEASTLVITGTGLTVADSIVLVHDAGMVTIALSDQGVTVSDDQIIITSVALDGLHVTRISAIRLVEDGEVVVSLNVDVTIINSDTEPPAIITEGDLVREAQSEHGAAVTYFVTATDAVDGPVAAHCSPESGSLFALGTTPVTCSASDAAGNANEATFTVEVVDTTGPAITVPDPIVVDSADAAGLAAEYDAMAVDMVDGATSIACLPASGSMFPIGVSNVLCEATDTRGNTSAATFTIIVRDIVPPILALEGEPVARVSDEAGEEAEFDFVVRALDAVDGGIDAACDPASGSVLTPGEHLVHCTATDAHGNTGTLEFTLTVVLVTPHSLAEERINDAHPAIFEQGYSVNLPMGAVVGTPSTDRIVMDIDDGSGGTRRVWAEGVFGYVDAQGESQVIDTSLVPVAGGYSAVSVPYSATLPARFSDGVRWSLGNGRGDVVIAPLNARAGAPDGEVMHDDDHVLYPLAWPRIDVVATTSDIGVHEHFVARSTDAPRVLSWRISHPAGSRVSIRNAEVVVEFADGYVQVLSRSPRARDAAGQMIPARYVVSSETGGTVLELHWDTTPATMGGALEDPIAWPVDVDPDYAIPVAPEDDMRPHESQDTTDGTNIIVNCSGNVMDIVFIGDGVNRHRDWEFGQCTLLGPPPGAEWVELRADFSWGISPNQTMSLVDKDGDAPTDSDGGYLKEHSPFLAGLGATGESTVTWNDDPDREQFAPVGEVNLILEQTNGATPKEGQDNQAILRNVVRVFADDFEPELEVIAPSDAALLSAGPVLIKSVASDDGSGCAGGEIVVTDAEGTVRFRSSYDGCSFEATPTFLVPGEYEIEFVARDAVKLKAIDYRSFTIADPIASIVDGDALSDIEQIELEVAQDLTLGTVQMYAVGPSGFSFPVGAAIAAGGYHSASFDTRLVQNGDYVVSLTLANGAGVHVLEAVTITVDNPVPSIGSGSNLSTSGIGHGFSVGHATGNLHASVLDANQAAWAGTRLEFRRAYNHQAGETASGLLGIGWRSSWERRLVVGLDNVVTYVDEAGHRWAFYPNVAAGTWSRAAGQRNELRRITNGSWELVAPDGRVTGFDALGQLTHERWPMGHALTYERSANTARVSDGHGHALNALLDAQGRIISVTDSIDRTWRYSYTAAGELWHITDPTEAQWEYGYDATHRIDRIRTPLHHSTPVTYDAAEPFSRVSQVAHPGLPARTFDYAVDSEVTERFAAQATVHEFDEVGRAVRRTDPRGFAHETAYNSLGQVTSMLHENIDLDETTSFVYDGSGNLTLERDAEDRETVYSDFDSFGNPRRVEDPMHRVTNYTFDAYGNELTRTTPELHTWRTEYAYGTPQPSSTTNPLGQVRQYDYDATGQVAREFYVDSAGVTRNVSRATYDDAGQKLTTRDGERPEQAYAYDGVGRIKRHTDENGHYTETTYDALGRATIERDKQGLLTFHFFDEQTGFKRRTMHSPPFGVASSFEPDVYGNVLRTIEEGRVVTEATFDLGGNKLTEKDALNNLTSYTYDSRGRVLTKTEPGSVGTIDAVTGQQDASGIITEYAYDATGAQTSIVEDGVETKFTQYRADGNVDVEVDAGGAATTYGYDANGNQTSSTDHESDTEQSVFDAADRETATIDPLNQRTDMVLDEQDRLREEIQPAVNGVTARTKYEYGLSDEITRMTDPIDAVTEMGYDPAGRLTSEKEPGLAPVSYTLDGNGEVETETNELGGVTRVERDEAGRIAKVTHPDLSHATFTYDQIGNLETETDEHGNTTTYGYDAKNRIKTITDPEDGVTSYEYDKRDNVVSEVDASGLRTQYVYDTRDNVRAITGAGLTTRFEYDNAHRLTKRTEPDGRISTYTYWPTGLLKAENDATRGTTTYTYDKNGRVKTVTEPSGTTTFTYDARGNTTQIQGPTGTSTYTFDKSGNVKTQSGEGESRTIAYDAYGRPSSYEAGGITFANLAYTYDAAGNVATMGRQNLHSMATNYNAAGQLQSLATSNSTGSAVETYDHIRKPSSLGVRDQVSRGGLIWDRHYDKRDLYLGERRAMPSGLATSVGISYDDAGRPERTHSTIAGLGLVDTYYEHHPLTGALRHDLSGPASKSVGYEYRYNSGRIEYTALYAPYWQDGITSQFVALVRECVNPSVCRDPDVAAAVGRLTSTPLTNAELESMTALENKVLAAINQANLDFDPIKVRENHYDPSTKRLAWIHDYITGKRVDYGYDNRGNQTSRTRTGEQSFVSDSSFSFDARNRLIQATERHGNDYDTVRYRYDADGHLIERHWGTRFVSVREFAAFRYDMQGRPYLFSHNRNNERQFEAFVGYNEHGLANMRVRKVNLVNGAQSEANYYFHFNHRGDTILITDSAGSAAVRYRYTPWGAMTATGDTDLIAMNPFTYQGQHGTIYDSYHKRYYMGVRWYDPYQAQFISPDPQPSQAGLSDSPYVYAANNPVSYVDTDGLAAKKFKARPKVVKGAKRAKPPRAPKPGKEVKRAQPSRPHIGTSPKDLSSKTKTRSGGSCAVVATPYFGDNSYSLPVELACGTAWRRAVTMKVKIMYCKTQSRPVGPTPATPASGCDAPIWAYSLGHERLELGPERFSYNSDRRKYIANYRHFRNDEASGMDYSHWRDRCFSGMGVEEFTLWQFVFRYQAQSPTGDWAAWRNARSPKSSLRSWNPC